MTPDKTHNPTFYDTVVHSPQWQAWVRRNEEDLQWDVHESMECGWLSEGHFQAFLTQHHQDLIDEIVLKLERMKKERNFSKDGAGVIIVDVYNQAIDDIIKTLTKE